MRQAFFKAARTASQRTLSVRATVVAPAPRAVQLNFRPFTSSITRWDNSVGSTNPTESEEAVKAETVAEDPLAESSSSSSSSKAHVASLGHMPGEQPTASEEGVRADKTPIDVEDLATVDPVDAQKRTVFVGGLSWSVDDEWLRDAIYKALDVSSGIKSARIARKGNGQSKGFAFVEFENEHLAKQSLPLELELDGRTARFQQSTSRSRTSSAGVRRERPTSPRNPPNTSVWLGNVPWSAEEDVIEHLFSPFGEIRRVVKPKDRETGRDRGIAYVEYANLADAEAAVTAAFESGVELEGRILRVDYAAARNSSYNNNSRQ